jgi:hypothetical protein
VHINFLSEHRTHPQKKCRGNEISLTPNNISVKCSIWSAEEISSKKNLIVAIYFCPILEILRKEMSSKQNLSNAKCFCEILDRIRGSNFKQTKTSLMRPYISVNSSN